MDRALQRANVDETRHENTQTRRWVATINNPRDDIVDQIGRLVQEGHLQYAAIGAETSASGTRHLQCYFVFPPGVRPRGSTVRRTFPGAWVAPAAADDAANQEYVKKDGQCTEIGTLDTGRGEVVDKYRVAFEQAASGHVSDVEPRLQICNYAALRAIEREYQPRPQHLTYQPGLWVWGPSNTGKSTGILNAFPRDQILEKDPGNKWFDGINPNVKVLVMDEFGPGHAKYQTANVLRWAGQHVFKAEVKGGVADARPAIVAVTSNYSIDDLWPAAQHPQTNAAMHKRFTEVHVEKLGDFTPAIARRKCDEIIAKGDGVQILDEIPNRVRPRSPEADARRSPQRRVEL